MSEFIAITGQSFRSQQEWINRATRVLTSHPKYNNTQHGDIKGYRGKHFAAMCFDQMGRRCTCGKDFQQAEDDKAYPIWWVWPDQIAELIMNVRPEPEIVDMSDAISAYEDELVAQYKVDDEVAL